MYLFISEKMEMKYDRNKNIIIKYSILQNTLETWTENQNTQSTILSFA